MSFTIANAEKNTLSSKSKQNKYSVANYQVDLNNTADSHSIIANQALGSKQILDLGCGVGYIGRAIKEKQACTVHGIDIDKVALKEAQKYYDQVFLMCIGDQTDQSFLSFLHKKETYDCIVCGDIIEHLVDPGYILSILAKKLAPNGKILVSIPNIAHIDVIANLLDGKFNYGETGILDNTHLRFWTENSFYEFIENVNHHYNINLSPKLIKKTSVDPPSIDTQYFHKICGDEIFTFQNIFELKKTKNPTIPHPHKRDNYRNISIAIKERDEFAANLAEKEKILHDIEHSLSWKITKPLRELNKLLHRS